jgi:hypothetical protein
MFFPKGTQTRCLTYQSLNITCFLRLLNITFETRVSKLLKQISFKHLVLTLSDLVLTLSDPLSEDNYDFKWI